VPAQTFQTSDGHVSLFVGNDPMWRRFCAAVGDPGLEAGEYATSAGRAANRRQLLDILSALFLTRRTQHWVTLFERVGVPCEPVNTLSEALADPQIAARSLTVRSQGAGAPYEHARGPVPLDATKAAVPAPALGADNWPILTGIGFAPAEIQDLIDHGALSSDALDTDLAAQ
jgi:crotonobetainyl-CoA:carnitine CoA-transferase CaiB-like acyl-CoA transferase